MAVHGIAQHYLTDKFFWNPRITRINATQMAEIIHKTESYAIIGACFEVLQREGLRIS